MRKLGFIALAGLLILLAPGRPHAHAGLLGGGFESGLSGWSTLGDVLAVDSSFGVAPVEGSGMALLTTSSDDGDANNFSGDDAVAAASLEAALGLAAGSLVGAVEGSALFQSFAAAAGDVLSFRYNFLSTEGSKDDYAFVSLVGLAALAGVSDATTPSSAVLDPVFESPTSESGWRTFSFTFATAGAYTLALGVVDRDDEFEPSALLVDDVRLQTVPTLIPEPSSALLLGVAAAVLALGSRRRLKASA